MDRVAPVRRGSRYHFAAAGVTLVVDPELGGRIVEFSFRGKNALFVGDGDGNWGSTFWTSPQSAWGWPPPAEIDREPYFVVEQSDRISIASRLQRALGVSVKKNVSMASVGVVTIEYTITNESPSARAVAPWEVTRVPKRGTSFFQRGSEIRASPQFPPPPYEEFEGVIWLQHSANDADNRKLHAIGPCRWLAHAADGLLYVKTFEGAAAGAEAPGEGAVEIFVSGSDPYVELEQQGSYERLEPGTSLAWRVVWRLVDAPSERDALVARVHALLS